MAEKKTRKQQAEETKRHIFSTALRMLNEQEFDSIKIRDIVREAGVSIGTFYNYYTTKVDVFYETYHLADEYFAQTVAPSLSQESVRERIFLFFDYYARYSCEFTSLALTKLLYNSNNKSFDRQVSVGMLPILVDLMRQGVASGELHSDETPEEMGQFLIVAVRGQVYHWCTNEGSYDLREAVQKFVARLLRAYQ